MNLTLLNKTVTFLAPRNSPIFVAFTLVKQYFLTYFFQLFVKKKKKSQFE